MTQTEFSKALDVMDRLNSLKSMQESFVMAIEITNGETNVCIPLQIAGKLTQELKDEFSHIGQVVAKDLAKHIDFKVKKAEKEFQNLFDAEYRLKLSQPKQETIF